LSGQARRGACIKEGGRVAEVCWWSRHRTVSYFQTLLICSWPFSPHPISHATRASSFEVPSRLTHAVLADLDHSPKCSSDCRFLWHASASTPRPPPRSPSVFPTPAFPSPLVRRPRAGPPTKDRRATAVLKLIFFPRQLDRYNPPPAAPNTGASATAAAAATEPCISSLSGLRTKRDSGTAPPASPVRISSGGSGEACAVFPSPPSVAVAAAAAPCGSGWRWH